MRAPHRAFLHRLPAQARDGGRDRPRSGARPQSARCSRGVCHRSKASRRPILEKARRRRGSERALVMSAFPEHMALEPIDLAMSYVMRSGRIDLGRPAPALPALRRAAASGSGGKTSRPSSGARAGVPIALARWVPRKEGNPDHDHHRCGFGSRCSWVSGSRVDALGPGMTIPGLHSASSKRGRNGMRRIDPEDLQLLGGRTPAPRVRARSERLFGMAFDVGP